MKLSTPLDDVLGNQARIRILRTLFKYPGEFTGRHIARLCKLPQATVQKQLQLLANNHVLVYKHFGNSRVFSLNKESILFQTLKDLFESEAEALPTLERLIRQAFSSKDVRNRLVHASIYGSAARGEESPQSDIDLLVLFGKPSDKNLIKDKLEELSRQVTTVSGMHLHPYVKTVDELKRYSPTLLQEAKSSYKLLLGKPIEVVDKA